MSYELTSGIPTTHPTPPEVAAIAAVRKEISQLPNILSKGPPGASKYGIATGSYKSLTTTNEAPEHRFCEVMLASRTNPVGRSRAASGRTDSPETGR